MPVLIGHQLSREFLGSKMVVHVGVGVAAEPVPDTVLHPSIWQYLLDAGSGDLAGGKGVALHSDRYFGEHSLDVERLQFASVQRRAEVREAAIRVTIEATAKVILPARIQGQGFTHPRSVALEEF